MERVLPSHIPWRPRGCFLLVLNETLRYTVAHRNRKSRRVDFSVVDIVSLKGYAAT